MILILNLIEYQFFEKNLNIVNEKNVFNYKNIPKYYIFIGNGHLLI